MAELHGKRTTMYPKAVDVNRAYALIFIKTHIIIQSGLLNRCSSSATKEVFA